MEIFQFLFLANNYMLKLKMKRGDGGPGVYFHSAKGTREEGHSEGLECREGWEDHTQRSPHLPITVSTTVPRWDGTASSQLVSAAVCA